MILKYRLRERTGHQQSDELLFTDLSNGQDLSNQDLSLPSYGHVTVRVTNTPREVGEFKYSLVVQNNVDMSNSEEIEIHTEVTPSRRSEGLQINPGAGKRIEEIDFGDI